ncbi:DUF4347 domain-containing protein, partial [Vibrio campbellii]|uniref:DUF4347 domain-containing protein n=1 Tax=Vibrio campbellii TaxID=680 RepID=UPI00142E789E
QASLSQLKALLPRGSQWNLYACDLAQGAQGKAFVDALSDALDVPIAASTNKTGVIGGADTTLEYQLLFNSRVVLEATELNFLGYAHTLSLLELEDYANNSSNITRPDQLVYNAAGIMDARAVNLDDYAQELVNQNASLDFTTTADIQALVDAINLLDDYADGTTSTAPRLTTYHTAGFDEVQKANVSVINTVLVNKTLTTLADVQTTVSALYKLVNYAFGNTSTTPIIDDYTNAGVTSVSLDIIDYINSQMSQLTNDEGFTHYLKASNADDLDWFGYKVAISDDGETILVLSRSAPSTSAGTDNAGAAYVYRRAGTSWQEVNILRTEQSINSIVDMAVSDDGKRVVLIAENTAYVFDVAMVAGQPDWRGSWTMDSVVHSVPDNIIYGAISGDGNVLLISDRNHRVNSVYTGRILTFRFINGVWVSQSEITGVANVGFGSALAISSNGDVIVVGASSHSSTAAGRAYVYRYDSNDWIREQMLEASNPGGSDHFGKSVSINAAGDRIVVGADHEDGYLDNIENTGAVYVFDHNGNSWSETQMLRTSATGRNIKFGFTVNLSADGLQLAVGSISGESLYSYDLNNVDSTQWYASEKRFNSPSSSNYFGRAVALNGSAFLAGHHYDDYNYNGIVTNSDNNQVFDDNDTSSTGTDFNNLDTTLTDSGGVYVIANESYALSSLNGLQATVDASNAILAWAAGGSTAPTRQQYIDAAIENVTTSNLDDINIQLQRFAHTDMFDIQPMVDAINKILAYSASSSAMPANAPTVTDYQLAGVPLFLPEADLNALILGQSYTIQEILELFPIPQPRLDVDTPLHINDTIGWLNQQQVEDAFNLYENSNPGATLTYVWQSKLPTDTSWTDVSGPQGISAYSDLTSLVVDLEYRLLLTVTRPSYADFTNFSEATSSVMGGALTDIDMSWDVINPPQEGVPYTVVSRLEPVTNYKDRVLTWYSLDSGTLVQLQQGERYTPDSSRVDNPLLVNVAYYAANGDVILARDILTPDVIAAPTSTDLTDLAGVLSLALTPDGVSVGTEVRLVPEDQRAIDATVQSGSIQVTYQWQVGGPGTWSDVTGTGNGASYVAQLSDVGERLHLVLTLTDTATNESIELTSHYSGVVQANDTGLETFTLFLDFDGSLLSLTPASAERVAAFMNDESLLNPTYAWLRMPSSGGGFEVGTEVGTDAGGYTFDTVADAGFRHGLRVTLEDRNGQTVTLFSDITRAWDGNTDPGDGSDLATELERLRYMDV